MLNHLHHSPQVPTRVAVLGGGGFLGRALARDLLREQISTLVLTRRELDLEKPDADKQLAQVLKPDDVIVILSALTPDRGRDVATLMRNLTMLESFCRAPIECAHVIYVSSDAVYPLTETHVSEQTSAAPEDLYGTMHRAREVMLRNTLKSPLAILRPTMLYGSEDTHNSYGPNRFRRQAAENSRIELAGEGEETRDHVLVDDAAAIIRLCITHRATGTLNIATGRSTSFMDVARLVASQFEKPVRIETRPRQSPITHRSFDITECGRAFPSFRYTPLEKGLSLVHQASLAGAE
jgi:nucleoside-diphosphate-sugar epimerase